MKNLPVITIIAGLIFTLATTPIFADTLTRYGSPEILINEIYPNPNAEEQEFIEFYITDSQITSTENYYILDEAQFSKFLEGNTYTKKYLPENYEQKDLTILEFSSGILNNSGGDLIALINSETEDIVDVICYGTVESNVVNYCNRNLPIPQKGESLSYIEEKSEFIITSPTPLENNIFINWQIILKNEEGIEQINFVKGEIIYIQDLSEIYGLNENTIAFYLDNEIINTNEIFTNELDAGTYNIKAQIDIYETIITFTLNESFTKLEISEVFPNPEGKDQTGINEWIEIYNSGNNSINLKGLIIERFTETQTYQHKITEDQVLESKSYIVIYPNFALTNENGDLKLLDYAQNLIHQFSYNIKVNEEESLILFEDEILLTTTPTKGVSNIYTDRIKEEEEEDENKKRDNDSAENSIGNKDFSSLEISEVFPNPEGTDEKGKNEWIELYNKGNNQINLKGLIINQLTPKSYDFKIEEDLLINGKSYIVIYPNFTINNTNAEILLKNGNQEIFDEIFYNENVKENISLIRQDGTNELRKTTIVTPWKSNIQTGSVLSAEDIDEEPINSAKEKKPESITAVKGAITVEPGILGDNIFYIQDESGGVQIESKNLENIKFLQKDIVVEIVGETDEYHSEIKINVDSESITPSNQSNVVQSKLVKIGEIDIGSIGSLITIKGYVVKTSGNTFYVNDSTGTLKVQIKDSTNIIRPECRKDYYAEITGLLSVWDTDENGNPNYRLLPRYQEDVFISKTLAKTGGNNWIGFFFGLNLILIYSILIFKESRLRIENS